MGPDGNIHQAVNIYYWEWADGKDVAPIEIMETHRNARYQTAKMVCNLSAMQRLVDEYDNLPKPMQEKLKDVKRRKFDLEDA